jgi:hypothetical protein
MQLNHLRDLACILILISCWACSRSGNLQGHWRGSITTEGNHSDQLPIEIELKKSGDSFLGAVRIGQGIGQLNIGQPFTLSVLMVVPKENKGLLVSAFHGMMERNSSISLNGTVSGGEFTGQAEVSDLNNLGTDGKVVASGSFKLSKE